MNTSQTMASDIGKQCLIDAKELERLRRTVEEYEALRQRAAEIRLLTEQMAISSLTAEINALKTELHEYKTQVSNITKGRVNKKTKEEMDLMEKFFRDHLVAKKGATVKTVDVMTKANEVLADHSIRFNKFEVAKFMNDKGITKKKYGGSSYYQDIKFV